MTLPQILKIETTLQINRGNNFPVLSKWYPFFNCFLRGAIHTKANLKIFHGHDDAYLFNPKTAKKLLAFNSKHNIIYH